MSRRASYTLRAVAAVVLVLAAAQAARAQLDERCTVSVLNRTVRVNADGSWVLPNIPAGFGPVKARATCVRDGVTMSGESEFFTVPVNGSVDVPPIVLGTAGQVPVSLGLTPAAVSLNAAGQTAQLSVTATYPDGSSRVVNALDAGTSYTTSNPAIATVSEGGLLTAVGSGTVIVQAINDGATAMMTAAVVLSGTDSDGDGIPDDAEVRLGLDPRNPADAQEDFDRDGYTNLEEYRLGTDIRVADRDEDGLSDGEELNTYHTSPLQADTDGDDIPDGVEVRTGSNPLDRNSYDLLKATAGSVMSPASFTLKTSLLFPNASKRLSWKVNLIDGKTTLDLTADPRTSYSSNNVTVCNFGAQKGEVFAGSPGACVVTASNGTLSVGVPGVVESFTPRALSYVDLPGFANNVEVGGNYAYVAAGGAGLQVVDVSDHAHPRVAAARALPGNANDVTLSGNYAYVAAGSGGLQVVDVSNPLAPVVVGSLDTAGVAWDVVVKGGRAYVANGPAGLVIVDVSTPSAPARLGSLGLNIFTTTGVDVDAVRQIAVLAQRTSGLLVVNVANPTAPNPMSRLAGGDVRDVAISGNYAFLADYSRSFTSVDLTNPLQPVLRASANPTVGGLLQDVSVFGNYAAGADVFFVNGVPLIDVSNPAGPQPRTIIDFRSFRDDNGTGVALDASYVYLTADPTGSENGVSGTTRLYIGQYQNIDDGLGVRPSIRITTPAPGAEAIRGDPLTVTVDAADDIAVASVSFFVNGQQAFTTTVPPHQYTFTAPATGSTLTLGASATDFGGNVARADDVTLNLVPDPPPSVQITSPAAGTQVIHGSALTVAAEATDNGAVSSVSFFVNGQQVSTATAAPYRYTFTAPTSGSTLTLGASGTDSEGNVGQAAAVTLGLIPDPLTNATGRVLKWGQPVVGVSVKVLGSYTATTGADGIFNIAAVPTISGDLVANATYTHPSGSVLAGASNPAAPVRGGTTNVGDIVLTNTAKLIISEFRWQGPGGAADEFVELYNSGDTPHLVEPSDGSAGYALAASDGTVRFVIPSGTVIPARAHFLGVNSAGYSLAAYPAGDSSTATGDATFTNDIPDNVGVALFNTSNPANFNLANRLDAVGSNVEANALFREGAGVVWPAGYASPYTCYRSLCSYVTGAACAVPGTPKETNDNAADFACVSANGPGGGAAAGQRLGAAGPENLSSPTRGVVTATAGANITVGPFSTVWGPTSGPNLVRETTSDPANNATYGLIKFRVRVTNNTGANITRLRFRIADLTTYPSPAGTADLRARTSGDTGGQIAPNVYVPIRGTTLEQSFQQYGGGFNSSLSVPIVTLSQPLAPGGVAYLQFVFGVQQTGTYRLGLSMETLPRSNTNMIVFTGSTN